MKKYFVPVLFALSFSTVYSVEKLDESPDTSNPSLKLMTVAFDLKEERAAIVGDWIMRSIHKTLQDLLEFEIVEDKLNLKLTWREDKAPHTLATKTYPFSCTINSRVAEIPNHFYVPFERDVLKPFFAGLSPALNNFLKDLPAAPSLVGKLQIAANFPSLIRVLSEDWPVTLSLNNTNNEVTLSSEENQRSSIKLAYYRTFDEAARALDFMKSDDITKFIKALDILSTLQQQQPEKFATLQQRMSA